jgi:hypothetical protein
VRLVPSVIEAIRPKEWQAMNDKRTDQVTASMVELRNDLEASARALYAADDAHVHAAMDRVRWERRGLLQRLTRSAG